MGPLFSSQASHVPVPQAVSKPPEMSDFDKATMQLKITRDKLHKYQKKAQKDSETYVLKAKELVKQGRKDRALVALKMKKYKDKQCKTLEGQLENVAHMLNSMESADMTRKVMTALDNGNKALKKLNDEMPIEKIEEIMQDSQEAIAYQNEVSDVLSKSLSTEDDYEVDAELMEMQAQLSGVNKLPVAPKNKVILEPDTDEEPERSANTRVLEPV